MTKCMRTITRTFKNIDASYLHHVAELRARAVFWIGMRVTDARDGDAPGAEVAQQPLVAVQTLLQCAVAKTVS